MKLLLLVLAFLPLFTFIDCTVDVNSSSSNNNSSREARFEDRRFRQEQDKKEVTTFLTTKNIVKTVVKLLFGTNEESSATSRQVLNVLVKVLDMLRSSFGQRARSSNGGGIREVADSAALAGTSLMKGFVQALLTDNSNQCSQRYICEACKSAVREGRELGYLIAQVGGYASSYLLENQKEIPFSKTYEAVRRGRTGESCANLYPNCNETD